MARTDRTKPLSSIYRGPLAPLADLAMNLWWSWDPEATALLSEIAPNLWATTEHNPVAMLRRLPAGRRKALSTDLEFLARLQRAHRRFRAYLRRRTWYQQKVGRSVKGHIAYYCMEYGLHESLPIYAGGLGILAGDHLKAASDVGLPLVGVGVFWRHGYVRQHIDRSGRQADWFVNLAAGDLPLQEVRNRAGRPLRLRIPLAKDSLVIRAWRLDVGRVPLYLLDTDILENRRRHRALSYRLYCNDREDRIGQEILLGIGGYRLLKALGIPVAAHHLNEGHAAFASVDRLVELVTRRNRPRREATGCVASTSVFTTHTPVPAGNEVFDPKLVRKYLEPSRRKLSMEERAFYGLGRVDPDDSSEPYGLTPLALRLSNHRNGVSALHGAVARGMWREVWRGRTVARVPIGSITNGIHLKTWLHPRMAELLDDHLPKDWDDRQDQHRVWAAVRDIPDPALWDVHQALKAELIAFVRDRLRAQLRRHRAGARKIREVDSILDPNALTLGFARRFAPYKRATLVFSDLDRLDRILNHPDRPVQILFAGKAHPGDPSGGALIAKIEKLARTRRFRRRVVLVEDYTIDVARHLVSGVDVWLNNPVRPQEASGTSGMKPTLHGGLNLSILDGWWPEGYDGRNGWAIGAGKDHRGTKADDRRDAAALYRTLQREVIPLFFDRTKAGLPKKWITRMKRSLATVPPQFNATRMVKEYLRRYYLPALRAANRLGV